MEEDRVNTDAHLRIDHRNLKKELFDLRFRTATETSVDPSRIKVARRAVARINTVLHERATGVRGQESR